MPAQEQGPEGGKEKFCGVEVERGEQLGNEFQRFGQSSTTEVGEAGVEPQAPASSPCSPSTGPGSGNNDQEWVLWSVNCVPGTVLRV